MSSHRAIAVAALTLAVTACAGSSTDNVRPPPSPVRSGPEASSTPRAAEAREKPDTTRSALADADVAAAVRRGLGPELADVEVIAQGGIVSLRGTAPHLLAKDDATRVAEATPGVRAVSNQLAVELAARTDREIATDIERTLRGDPATETTEIDVEVESGTATLRGTVEFPTEREVVERIAKSIRGVREVEDLLVVLREAEPTDAEVPPEEIVQALVDVMRIDPRVDHRTIDVSVTGSVVRLSGAVPDEQAKRVAEELARHTFGVAAVGNDIVVTARRVTDADIERQIRLALASSRVTDSLEIRVRSEEGRVVLEGEVDSFEEKAQAESIAVGRRGVREVVNELRVRQPTPSTLDVPGEVFDPYVVAEPGLSPPPSTPTDALIEARILDNLVWSERVAAKDVRVNVIAGAATLSGRVATWAEREAALAAAYAGGATSVIDELRVGSSQ